MSIHSNIGATVEINSVDTGQIKRIVEEKQDEIYFSDTDGRKSSVLFRQNLIKMDTSRE